MKPKKIRLLPAFITLSAGAITSISLYVTNQDLITTLLVLFIVLFVFYFIGVLAMKIIMDFMKRKKKWKRSLYLMKDRYSKKILMSNDLG